MDKAADRRTPGLQIEGFLVHCRKLYHIQLTIGSGCPVGAYRS